jgi:quinoprotein glucose dehydrogenase
MRLWYPSSSIMKGKLLLAVALLTTVLFASAQEEEETRSVQSGVYTEEQAERGAAIFEETCMSCHKPGEFGDGAYIDSWSGQTAHDLIELIRATMPQDNPGSLKRKDYVDIVAYLFRSNGLPAGDTEMDVNSVKRILIEGPYHPSEGFFSR